MRGRWVAWAWVVVCCWVHVHYTDVRHLACLVSTQAPAFVRAELALPRFGWRTLQPPVSRHAQSVSHHPCNTRSQRDAQPHWKQVGRDVKHSSKKQQPLQVDHRRSQGPLTVTSERTISLASIRPSTRISSTHAAVMRSSDCRGRRGLRCRAGLQVGGRPAWLGCDALGWAAGLKEGLQPCMVSARALEVSGLFHQHTHAQAHQTPHH